MQNNNIETAFIEWQQKYEEIKANQDRENSEYEDRDFAGQLRAMNLSKPLIEALYAERVSNIDSGDLEVK